MPEYLSILGSWVFGYLGIWDLEKGAVHPSCCSLERSCPVFPSLTAVLLPTLSPAHRCIIAHCVRLCVLVLTHPCLRHTAMCHCTLNHTESHKDVCSYHLCLWHNSVLLSITAVLLPTVSLAHAWKAHIFLHRIYTQLYFTPNVNACPCLQSHFSAILSICFCLNSFLVTQG